MSDCRLNGWAWLHKGSPFGPRFQPCSCLALFLAAHDFDQWINNPSQALKQATSWHARMLAQLSWHYLASVSQLSNHDRKVRKTGAARKKTTKKEASVVPIKTASDGVQHHFLHIRPFQSFTTEIQRRHLPSSPARPTYSPTSASWGRLTQSKPFVRRTSTWRSSEDPEVVPPLISTLARKRTSSCQGRGWTEIVETGTIGS